MAAQGKSMEYVSINRDNWNERAEIHAQSQMYNFAAFADPKYISHVVKYDQAGLLPSMKDKHVIHLQSHIGTDSLSLARLGAASVTLLDFSSASLAHAKKLADSCKTSGGDKLRFIEASVYNAADPAIYADGAPKPREFDVVFTGVGSLCWIHSIRMWANIVGKLLKPGGKLFIRDGHPMLYTIDDVAAAATGELSVHYSYFEREEGEVTEVGGTYTDVAEGAKVDFKAKKTVEFNHGIGELVQAVIDSGMRITNLKEHMEMPWNGLAGQMDEVDLGTGRSEWRLRDRPWRLPHMFTLVAEKE